MEMELMRGMDVDMGVGLGDDLGGFEGFDAIFAEANNTTDFFKCCALEEVQEQEDVATISASHGTSSPVTSFGQPLKGHDFAVESRSTGGQEQVQAWLTPGLSTSEPSRHPNVLVHTDGKPRARKRHDEEGVVEAEEATFPLIKRRSSPGSSAAPSVAPPNGLEKSRSFCLTTSPSGGRLTSAAPQQQQQGLTASGGGDRKGRMSPPAGGAIKVNTDVISGNMRPPRISVFMSRPMRRVTAVTPSSSPAINQTMASQPPSSLVPTAALPGSYGHACQHQELEPTMDRTASAQAQRLKDLRITMRGSAPRSLAEKYVIEHNPPVVAMGSPQLTSTSALLLDDAQSQRDFSSATPTLRRASSVGALTIAGAGDIHSASPVLSATGRIIQSCELSDRAGDGGQRRNLVCKVFGSGRSPYLGPTNSLR